MTSIIYKQMVMVTIVTILPSTMAQSLQVSPSLSGFSGMNLPLFTPSVQEQWPAASSTQPVVVKAHDQVARSSYRSADTAQLNKIPGMSPYDPIPYHNTTTTTTSYQQQHHDAHKSLLDDRYRTMQFRVLQWLARLKRCGTTVFVYIPDEYGRNQTSRFFSLNPGGSGSQTLDLGLSFTVPFISIPTSSLVNIGDQVGSVTTSALASFMDINWPSVFFIGVVILGAAFLLPQIASTLTDLTGSFGSPGAGSYTTTSYGRNVERAGDMLPAVAPLTSILMQLDDALAQYDLDATSCFQRAVCSYVGASENSISDGDADSTQMIVAGLARSGVVGMLGRDSITKATEMGLNGSNCQLQFPKCPFSVTGVLKFLATYSSLMAS